MMRPSALGVDNLTFESNRQRSACVCCSDGTEVVINANTYSDDHRMVPTEEPKDDSPGTARKCCNFVSGLFCRTSKEQKAILQAAEDRRAYQNLAETVINKVGTETAKEILADVNPQGPVRKRDLVRAITIADQYKFKRLYDEENPGNPTTAESVVLQIEPLQGGEKNRNSPSTRNFPSKSTPASAIVVRRDLKNHRAQSCRFDPSVIAATLARTTSEIDRGQIDEMTKEISKEITTVTQENGVITTTTITSLVITELRKRNIVPVAPPHSPFNQIGSLHLTKTPSQERLNPQQLLKNPSPPPSPRGSPRNQTGPLGFTKVPSKEKVED